MLRPFCMLLWVVAQSLKPVKLSSQQLPTFLLFRDRRRVAQQWWIRLHSSSNIVGATHAHYTWSPESYFSRCIAGPNIVGSFWVRLHTDANKDATTPNIVGCCCIRLHTIANTDATTLNIVGCCCIRLQTTANTDATTPQHFWLLLHPFAHHCQHRRNNFQHCWCVVASVCKPLLTQTQQLANIVGVLLHPFAHHC